MGYLRKRDTGAVTDFLEPDSLEYQTLKEMRFQSAVTANVPASTLGLPSGETGGTIAAGAPVWEDVNETDAGFPNPAGGRVAVIAIAPAATAAAETTSNIYNAQVAGSLTDVEFVANSPGIAGQATNYRTLTLQQVTLAGTSSPTRTVTAQATLAFSSTSVNATAGVPVALAIGTAAFVSGSELQVVSSVTGTGLADPGGVVYAVYTQA